MERVIQAVTGDGGCDECETTSKSIGSGERLLPICYPICGAPPDPSGRSGTVQAMAGFVKYDLGYVEAGASAEVTLAHRANVRLLDASSFARYERGETFSFIGGQAVRSPVVLTVPTAGHWYVVLDLGGGAGTIKSSVRVLQPA